MFCGGATVRLVCGVEQTVERVTRGDAVFACGAAGDAGDAAAERISALCEDAGDEPSPGDRDWLKELGLCETGDAPCRQPITPEVDYDR